MEILLLANFSETAVDVEYECFVLRVPFTEFVWV